MRCPVDDAPLREVTRSGVKIDLCGECRGVWLDRGELDHLLEASDDDDDSDRRREQGRTSESRAPRADYDDRDRRPSRDRDDDGRPSTGAKKRKSWLSEIFEFGE